MSWLRFFAEMVVTYIPSHFQWTWDDLGHSPFSKFLQYHHHPSKKPPRNLEVSARIPLVICLWTASEVTQMLTFDAWTSDWRWFPQYPPILCCMSRVCLARCFKSIFYILYAKHVFFSKKMVPSDVSRHAFIPPASPGPRLSCRLQASRSCSRWCSPVASLENSWESLAWRARTWRLGPVFPKFWSLWPRKGHAWHNHSIYTYRHTNIYI
jgi:hypothetical protein